MLVLPYGIYQFGSIHSCSCSYLRLKFTLSTKCPMKKPCLYKNLGTIRIKTQGREKKYSYFNVALYLKNAQYIFCLFLSEYNGRYPQYNTKYQELLGSVALEAVCFPVAYTALQTGYWGQGIQSVPHPPAAELPVAGQYGACQIEIQHPYHIEMGRRKNRHQ